MPEKLKSTLDELNKELDLHPQLSEDEKSSLLDLSKKIRQEIGAADELDANEIEKWVTHFRESHPDLSKMLRRVVDGLSGMGI